MSSITDSVLYVNFTMYGVKRFDDEIRRSFRLPGNPYSMKEKGIAARTYLKSLGIFFYRDEDNASAVIIDDGVDPILDRVGFIGFLSRGILSRETMAIGEWDKPKSQAEEADILKYKEKNGDTKSWLVWNKEGTVINLTSAQITFI